MTRKRFVKLLMAEGYSRNGANEIADKTIEDGFSYAEAYGHVIRDLQIVKAFSGRLADAAQKAAESLGRVARAVCEAASAAVKAFSAAMSQA